MVLYIEEAIKVRNLIQTVQYQMAACRERRWPNSACWGNIHIQESEKDVMTKMEKQQKEKYEENENRRRHMFKKNVCCKLKWVRRHINQLGLP